MVVGDDEQIRAFITYLLDDEGYTLEDEGYTTVTAADGATAMRMLQEHRPSPDALCLMILDMLLSEADGLEMLRSLARLGGYVPVIAMSAGGRRPLEVEVATAGAHATLSKPFEVERLLWPPSSGTVGKGAHAPPTTASPAAPRLGLPA
jgi:DNA-binding response OmpR family regulator